MKRKTDYTIPLLIALFVIACLCSCRTAKIQDTSYKGQYERLQKLLPGKDSLYIDAAIKED
jgi:DNA-binding transcriptional regulator of glucitol operon